MKHLILLLGLSLEMRNSTITFPETASPRHSQVRQKIMRAIITKKSIRDKYLTSGIQMDSK
ncbi:hypothetical protein YC2023_090312 [Brassica napus]